MTVQTKYFSTLLFILLSTLGLYSQANHPDDYTALRALYLSTGGDRWTDNTNWPDSATFAANPTPPAGTDMGSWFGITANNGRVEKISFDIIDQTSNNLVGTIPTELGNLSKLKTLNLPNNKLTGSIPAEIGDLKNLTYLYLVNNQLTGSIPAEIGDLTDLIDLFLGFNKLVGNIPAEIGDLTNLNSLGLSANQLTGSIPAEIGDLINLDDLDFGENQLTGSIPAEIGELKNLNYLYLYNNQLTGTVPMELGNLQNLKALFLGNNKLCGCYPENLNKLCDQLEEANISEGNNFEASWSDFCATGAGTEGVNCSSTCGQDSVNVEDCTSLLDTIITSPSICGVDSSGRIEIVLGDLPEDAQILWQDSTMEWVRSGLMGGEYKATISSPSEACTSSEISVSVLSEEKDSITYELVTDITGDCDSTAGTLTVMIDNPDDYEIHWSDGTMGPVLNDPDTTFYTVQIASKDGCAFVMDTFMIELSGDAMIEYTLTTEYSGDCDSGQASIKLNLDNPDDYDVLWSNGDVGLTIENAESGQYTVEIKPKNGCSSVFDTVSVEGFKHLQAMVDYDGGQCSKSDYLNIKVEIKGGVTPYTIEWSDGHSGETHPDVSFNAEDIYYTVSDSVGCSVKMLLQYDKNPMGLEYKKKHSENGNDGYIMTFVRGAEPVRYVWEDGSNARNRYDLSPGVYSLTAYDADDRIKTWEITIGDLSQGEFSLFAGPSVEFFSSETDVSSDGNIVISPWSRDKINLYPQPASDVLNMEFLSDFTPKEVSVYDPYGKTIYHSTVENQKLLQKDISLWKSGIYYVVIKSEKEVITKALFISK